MQKKLQSKNRQFNETRARKGKVNRRHTFITHLFN